MASLTVSDRSSIRETRSLDRVGLRSATLLFLVLLAVFYLSPVRHTTDSRYTVLLSEHLLVHRSFDLAPYFTPSVDSSDYPGFHLEPGLPRHVRRKGEHLYYLYPSGSSVLSMPLVAVMRWLGQSAVGEDGRYSAAGEQRIEAVVASVVAALTGVLFYAIARRLLDPGWSLAIALAGSLGSQLWSLASRVLWSHTWGLFLLTAALLLVLRSEGRDAGSQQRLLATVLSWAFFVRPTAVAYIVPIALYVVWRDRRRSVPFVATGLCWLAAFLIYSQLVFGQPLPDYYLRGNLQRLETLGTGLAANLVSPARGLLVYCPWLLLSLYLLARHGPRLRHRGLALAALAAIAIHVVIVSGNRNWWAGFGYGPRFTTETIPLWVLVTVIAWRATLDHRVRAGPRLVPARRHRARVQLAAVLLLVPSWTFHGAAALSPGWMGWNALPVPIRYQPERVFAWREAQFLWALNPQREVQRRRELREEQSPVRIAQSRRENRAARRARRRAARAHGRALATPASGFEPAIHPPGKEFP